MGSWHTLGMHICDTVLVGCSQLVPDADAAYFDRLLEFAVSSVEGWNGSLGTVRFLIPLGNMDYGSIVSVRRHRPLVALVGCIFE